MDFWGRSREKSLLQILLLALTLTFTANAAWAQDAEEEDEDVLSAETDEAADLDKVVEVLSTWDLEFNRDSAGALLWFPFMHQLGEIAANDDLPAVYDMAMSLMAVYVLKVTMNTIMGKSCARPMSRYCR